MLSDVVDHDLDKRTTLIDIGRLIESLSIIIAWVQVHKIREQWVNISDVNGNIDDRLS